MNEVVFYNFEKVPSLLDTFKSVKGWLESNSAKRLLKVSKLLVSYLNLSGFFVEVLSKSIASRVLSYSFFKLK